MQGSSQQEKGPWLINCANFHSHRFDQYNPLRSAPSSASAKVGNQHSSYQLPQAGGPTKPASDSQAIQPKTIKPVSSATQEFEHQNQRQQESDQDEEEDFSDEDSQEGNEYDYEGMANEAQLLKFFDECDIDGSGEITLAELKQAFAKKKVDERALKSYIDSFDRNHDGKISRDEYKQSLGLFPPKERQVMAWRGVFESFDKDGSGKISRDELDAVLREIHGGPHGYNAETLQRFLSQNDSDGDREIDYNEFLHWIRSSQH